MGDLAGMGIEQHRVEVADTGALFTAVERDDPGKMSELLDRNPEWVGRGTPSGVPVLGVAAALGCIAIVRLLLERGADVDGKDGGGKTALHGAALNGMAAALSVLLEAGGRRDAADKEGRTPLYDAVSQGNDECVRVLLEKEAGTELGDKTGNAPLHKAVRRNDSGCVRLLLAAGADPCVRDGQGRTALHYAAALPDVGIAGLLIENKGNVNAIDVEGNSPLHTAARGGVTAVRETQGEPGTAEAVRVLVAAGAEVNTVNRKRLTPLHLALFAGHAGRVRALLGAGADACIEDRYEDEPLQIAARMDDHEVAAECMQALIEAGAGIDAQDAYGLTALHIVVVRKNRLGVACLLAAGADVTVRAGHGMSPAQEARSLAEACDEGVYREIAEQLDRHNEACRAH